MASKKLTPGQRQARKQARQEAIQARERRRIAAGLPRPGSVGEALQRLQKCPGGNPLDTSPPAPGGFAEVHHGEPQGLITERLPILRATAKANTAEARRRIYVLAAQQERQQRAAHEKIDAMSEAERRALLEDLRAGRRPDWLGATHPSYNITE